MKAFSHFPFQTGKIADLDRQFPSYLSAFDNSRLAVHDTTGTHFGYVHKGSAQIVYQGRWYQVYAGHYFRSADRSRTSDASGISTAVPIPSWSRP
jgi:hypothetical protein